MIRKLLFLFAAVLTSVGTWADDAPTFTMATSSTTDMDVADRSITFTLKGDWNTLNSDLEARITEIIDQVQGVNDNVGFGKVIVKSYEEKTESSTTVSMIVVNKSLIQQLVSGKKTVNGDQVSWGTSVVTDLDLSDVYVDEFVGHAGSASQNDEATFTTQYAVPLKRLVMPQFADSDGECSIPSYTTAYMQNLEELILPLNTKKVCSAAFAGLTFAKFKLNEGLQFIGNSAFWADSKVDGMASLDIPGSVKYIGPGAFNFRIYTDVYFHSAQAPICPVGQSVVNKSMEVPFIYSICYDGNGGQNSTEGDDYKSGYANRQNYKNGIYWFLMLHYPSAADIVAPATLDVSSYKDATRIYHKTYGNQYNTTTGGPIEIAIPGNTYPVDNTKNYEAGVNYYWATEGAPDYVGLETTALSYEGKKTAVNGTGYVMSGYEDTYRGLSYIWPSQTQYVRAYVTVANGVNWDGVTKYRPTLTNDQIALMAEDKLTFTLNGTTYTVGNNITYDEESAAAYNATLEGAWQADGAKAWYTEETAKDYNATLEGAISAGDTKTFTYEEVNTYNAALPGAVKKGDVKTPAVATQFYTWAEFQATGNWRLSQDYTEDNFNADIAAASALEHPEWNYGDFIKVQGTAATYYQSDDEAKQYNATLEGAITKDVETLVTDEIATVYNSSLTGAVKAGDVSERYTAQEAKEHNAALTGAISAGTTIVNYNDPTVSDYMSMIAFQSTRRVVFDTDDAGGNDYKLHMSGKNWWTLCLPFDLTKAQIDKYFGKNTHVCNFNRVDRTVDATNGNSIKFYFTDDEYPGKTDTEVVLHAHTAYMIYPTLDDNDATGLAVTIPASDYYIQRGNPVPTIIASNAYDGYEGDDHTVYRFVGNYAVSESYTEEDGTIGTHTVTIPQYSYMYAKKSGATGKHPYKFWFVQNNGIAWPKNKCVIQASSKDGGSVDNDTFFTAGSGSSKTDYYTIFLDSDIDETTGIQNIQIIAGDKNHSEVIYNLNGQQLNTKPQHGIYIQNGKKYMVK